MTSFGLLKTLNPALVQDYAATISGSTISLVLPAGTDPAVLDSLVPSFAHTGKNVTVRGIVQTSSVTAQDFSPVAGLVYVLNAVDGSTASYTARITISGYIPAFTVSFDANSGSGSMADQPIAEGQTANLVAEQVHQNRLQLRWLEHCHGAVAPPTALHI